MKNWTVRTRIIGAFAAVIIIMIALSAVSFIGVRRIRAQASQIQRDVVPGVVISARSQALARELLLAVTTHAAASDARARQLAADSITRLLQIAARNDVAYTATIIDEGDRELFGAMRDARGRFEAAYAAAAVDSLLTQDELRTKLRPPLEEYVKLSDSLFDLNQAQGTAAATDITSSANTSLWTLGPALLLATIVALICSWLLVRLIQRAFARLLSVMSVMSAGDFRQRVQIVSRDELGLLGEGMNQMADDLTRIIDQVQRSGVQVNSSATEIAATSKQQQATVTEIAATTAEVGATASRISATSKELARTMAELSAVADQTSTLAEGGQGGLQRMEATMGQIGAASELINSRLGLLSEKATNIGMVVTTINKVADQTNLLSLNAAIEAEKAGEHGRGFAVVAREIRRLADQTAIATFDIEQIVKEMQSAVSAGVMGIDKFADEVRRGREAIGEVTLQLTEIISQVQTLPPSFESVNEGVQSQAISAAQISEALDQLSVASQQTADSLRQSNMAIEQLNDAARGLQSGVSRFTLAA
ncbi:MAG TPA: methyl-accepting chemotaxis protein [Gemmatimonadaceae bacterium]|nr:methyl-accepting chemotaxis protein [Gemmatimonadaceae bacterium]